MLGVGDKAPTIDLRGFDDKQYSLGRHWTLALFFKTSCPTCRYAWPFYERLYRAYHKAGLQVLGISQHDEARTRDFGKEYGTTFPLLIDKELWVSKEYDPDFVPTGFLIDPAGQITDTAAGWNRQEFRKLGSEIAGSLGVQAKTLIAPNEDVVSFKPG
ncbi:MAG: peroxiredoxin family protein [Rudaea sp.]